MRKPTYLSHSSLALWGKDKEEFYIKHLAETRAPRIAQGSLYVRAAGSFDAYAKSALHERLFGKGAAPSLQFQTILRESGRAAQRRFRNRSWQYIFDCYVLTGAFDELLAMLEKSKEPPASSSRSAEHDQWSADRRRRLPSFVHECNVM